MRRIGAPQVNTRVNYEKYLVANFSSKRVPPCAIYVLHILIYTELGRVAMNISSVHSNPNISAWDQAASGSDSARYSQLPQAVRLINNSNIFSPENELTLALDRNTHRPITRIVNRDTHQLVMQLPPEYILQLASQLQSGSQKGA